MDISIVICTYNRAERLHKVLTSLAEMVVDPNLDWEVIIVDNNSSDLTKDVVYDFISDHLLKVCYIFEPKQGLSHARNRGITEAKGEIISFLDDDVIVDKHWLSAVVRGFDLYDPMILGGRIVPYLQIELPKWIPLKNRGPLGEFDIGAAAVFSDTGYQSMIGIGANMSFKKKVFDLYGLFDPQLGRVGRNLATGEETELWRRVRDNGQRCMYYPEALVHHYVPPERLTKKYFRKYYFHIGRCEALTEKTNEKEMILIFGIPRWMYRKMIEYFWAYVIASIKSKGAEAQDKKMYFFTFLGYFAYAQRKVWVPRLNRSAE